MPPINLIIPRHKAALKRTNLSHPMRAVLEAGILEQQHQHLDYGCGRGDDVRFLRELGFCSSGYDPYYFPETPKKPVDIVTLLYVLSTIEIPSIRCEVLCKAYKLARQSLVVSALITRTNNYPGIVCNDGVITKWGTFEKCYSHTELKQLIEDTLGIPAHYLVQNTYTVPYHPKALPLNISSTNRNYLEKCCTTLQSQQQELLSEWIPPADANIEKHSLISRGKPYSYYRMKSRSRSLPNGKLTMHLGSATRERYIDAVEAIERRDLLSINYRRMVRIQAILDA